MMMKIIIIIIMMMLMIHPLALASAGRSSSSGNMSLPNCPDSCASVTIPYPFGIGTGCYHDPWFAITCQSNKPPYLTAFNLEFVSVDLLRQLLTVNIPNNASNSKCPDQNTSNTTVWASTNFAGTPFNVSRDYNQFTVVGCHNALLSYAGKTIAGCTSACIDNSNSPFTSTTDQSCYGIGCCQTEIPVDLDSYQVTISGNNNARNCTYAFVGQKGWYPSNVSKNGNMNEVDHVPLVLDWTPKDTFLFTSDYIRTPQYSCFNPTQSGGYIQCQCGWAYEGNPYIQNGCKVVEACASCENDCERRNVGGELQGRLQ